MVIDKTFIGIALLTIGNGKEIILRFVYHFFFARAANRSSISMLTFANLLNWVFGVSLRASSSLIECFQFSEYCETRAASF